MSGIIDWGDLEDDGGKKPMKKATTA
jgi:hypothetical protein